MTASVLQGHIYLINKSCYMLSSCYSTCVSLLFCWFWLPLFVSVLIKASAKWMHDEACLRADVCSGVTSCRRSSVRIGWGGSVQSCVRRRGWRSSSPSPSSRVAPASLQRTERCMMGSAAQVTGPLCFTGLWTMKKKWTSCPRPNVVPNLFDFVSSVEHKKSSCRRNAVQLQQRHKAP